MKVKEDKRTKQFFLSWRGEIKGNKMQGIASLRFESKSEDFSFTPLEIINITGRGSIKYAYT